MFIKSAGRQKVSKLLRFFLSNFWPFHCEFMALVIENLLQIYIFLNLNKINLEDCQLFSIPLHLTLIPFIYNDYNSLLLLFGSFSGWNWFKLDKTFLFRVKFFTHIGKFQPSIGWRLLHSTVSLSVKANRLSWGFFAPCGLRSPPPTS